MFFQKLTRTFQKLVIWGVSGSNSTPNRYFVTFCVERCPYCLCSCSGAQVVTFRGLGQKCYLGRTNVKPFLLRRGLPPLDPRSDGPSAPRADGRTEARADGRTEARRTDGRTAGRADGRTGGRTDGRTDGWTNQQPTNQPTSE